MPTYICMWKITTTMQIIIIWIIQYFSLKFISCRFYIWKIAKTKSLSPEFKKGYLDCEYAQTHVIQSFLDLIQFLFSWFINKKNRGMHLLWALTTCPPLVGVQGQEQIKVTWCSMCFMEEATHWVNDLLTRRMSHLYLHHT
jgi:hypothetical protein